LAALKAVLLEGLEVAFIVIAVGAGRGLLWPAALGALAACLVILAVGTVVHKLLTRVPENAVKFGVRRHDVRFWRILNRRRAGRRLAWPGCGPRGFRGSFPRNGLHSHVGASAHNGGYVMTIIAEVAKELLGMFIADVRLTAAILVLVAIVAILVVVWPVEPVLGGGVPLLDPSLFS
jgi:hypothetical protein